MFRKTIEVSAPLAILVLLTMSGCALTSTRPLQELSNSDAALKAAKDVNADSLSPDLYRAANENYFKAKREYRLKNFEAARRFSLRATKLAEEAEFEAYRLGGATPEVAGSQVAPEGASLDSDETLQNFREDEPAETPPSPKLKPQEDPNSFSATDKSESIESEKPAAEQAQAQTQETVQGQGTEYNEYLRQLEEERVRLESEKAKTEAEKARMDAEKAKFDLEQEKLKQTPPSNPQLQQLNSNTPVTNNN